MNNDLNKTPTVHQAFVSIVNEIKKANPKTSLQEGYEAGKNVFAQQHGVSYDYSERTFLNHYYNQ